MAMTPTVSPALKSYFSFSLEYLQWGIMMKRWLAQPLGNWQVGEEDLLELGNLLEELQYPWNTNLWTVSKEILVERGLRNVQPALFGLSRVNSWSIGKRVTHSNVQSKEERRSSTQQMHNWLFTAKEIRYLFLSSNKRLIMEFHLYFSNNVTPHL